MRFSFNPFMEKYSEEQLLEKLRDPRTQRQGFAILVSEYSERLYWQIRKMVLSHDDAHDILQDVFIKAWTNIDNFRGESKLTTWLYRIAINESITFLNKKRNQNNVSVDDENSFLLNTLESDEYFDEMKYEEMSDILGTSVGALKASYHHAVKKIENFLTDSN